MEPQFINYAQIVLPSLQNVAIVQIVASLLEQSDAKMELKKLTEHVMDTERTKGVAGCYNFREIENIIANKLTLLGIPKKLHNEILYFAKPIGLQMIKCFDIRKREYYYLYNTISKETFHWTSWGTIDKIKSLEHAVFQNYTAFNPEVHETLFEFACQYCLENCIFELWNKMTENQKDKFRHEDRNYKVTRMYIDSNLINYWVSVLENKLSSFCKCREFKLRKHSTPYSMLKLIIFSRSFLAVKYFWYELAKEERTDRNILRLLIKGIEQFQRRLWYERYDIKWYESQVSSDCTDIILFLMSQLSDHNQQKRVFKHYPEMVLKLLYNHWPYSAYFLPTIKEMWDYIGVDLHMEIVTTIIKEAAERNASRVLFKELWDSTPENIKSKFITSSSGRSKHELIELFRKW